MSIRAPLSLRVALGNLLTALHPRLLTRNTRLPQMGCEDYSDLIHVQQASL